MVEPKFLTNVPLAPWLTALGVPAAMGNGVRGDANSRQNWLVGPDPDAAAHGSGNPSAVGRGGSADRYKGPHPAASPSLLPPNLRLSTSPERF
jgi:uncharacterized membrane protein